MAGGKTPKVRPTERNGTILTSYRGLNCITKFFYSTKFSRGQARRIFSVVHGGEETTNFEDGQHLFGVTLRGLLPLGCDYPGRYNDRAKTWLLALVSGS